MGRFAGEKKEGRIRIGFQNIGPQATYKTDLNAMLTSKHITNNNYDIFMFAEHGFNANKLKAEDQWRERMGRTTQASTLAHNKNEATIGNGRTYEAQD